MNKTIAKSSLIAVIGLCAAVASASANDGYIFDTRGTAVKSGTGLCWHTTRWTPAMATMECDPDLVKKPAPAPAPMAAPMPKPAPAPAPAPVAAKPINLSATSLFGFDKAVLKPEAKAEIDQKVISHLASVGSVKTILIGGHTDRLGSATYNQKLSEKRADAVKDYLVAKGLDANLIQTLGYGKTQPAQGVPKCDDKLTRAKLIACLEPHRRVTVDIQAAPK